MLKGKLPYLAITANSQIIYMRIGNTLMPQQNIVIPLNNFVPSRFGSIIN
jgi:hypothetical protein